MPLHDEDPVWFNKSYVIVDRQHQHYQRILYGCHQTGWAHHTPGTPLMVHVLLDHHEGIVDYLQLKPSQLDFLNPREDFRVQGRLPTMQWSIPDDVALDRMNPESIPVHLWRRSYDHTADGRWFLAWHTRSL